MGKSFHVWMACVCAVILTISFVGCALTSIHTEAGWRALAVLVVLLVVSPVPVYWHEKGQFARREAALTIHWAVILAAILPFPTLVAARSRLPLRDTLFAHIDERVGVSVPAIVAWSSRHWLGTVLGASYVLLLVLIAAAIFAPALSGKVRTAREFLVANLVAFTVTVPILAILPAIGPWCVYHFPASNGQRFVEAQLLTLRQPGAYEYAGQGAGIICFPSFHVVWAMLCAAALWDFKALRIPVTALTVMIIVSTMTTGWHYFTDVIAGIVLGAISIAAARYLVGRDPSLQNLHRGS